MPLVAEAMARWVPAEHECDRGGRTWTSTWGG